MLSAKQREAIGALPVKEGGVRLMEVCGTHTMAIARAGIRQMLPEGAELLSGPGCPVCVTHQGVIDAFLELSMLPQVTIATYGDMIRVPGSRRGDNLARRRALGAKIEVVYSPVDAVAYAKEHPERQVVFLGVGFETTAPGTAAAVLTAREEGVENFFVLSMLKRVEPALRALVAMEDFQVDGFLCPGHVATILGEEGFRYLPEELHIPAVIGGIEPEDILTALCHLLRQTAEGEAKLENEYRRAVRPGGNPAALAMMERVLVPRDDLWRGLGFIPQSGYGFREEFAPWDAEKKFDLQVKESATIPGCSCGEIMKGRLHPHQCPLFGKVCTPEDPVGPCMVSSEGACAAAYKYRDFR